MPRRRRWTEAEKEYFRRRSARRAAESEGQGLRDWAFRREWEAQQDQQPRKEGKRT